MITRLAFPFVGALVVLVSAGSTYAVNYSGCDPGSACHRAPHIPWNVNREQCVENCYLTPLRRAECYNWNRRYAHVQYGQPVALVVPPTANLQTNWGWGVSSFRLSRLDHQFGRDYPGFGTFGAPYRTTPVWPWDTTQFGVYHVRGPW